MKHRNPLQGNFPIHLFHFLAFVVCRNSTLILAVLFLFSILSLACSHVPVRPSNLDTLDLQGHRGARGLKPENTWPGFRAAIDYRMTTLELDTVLTKDGHVIIHHDSETNPTICQMPDGTPIAPTNLYDLTLAELKALDCGSRKNPKFPEQIPVPGTKLITIQEFFDLVAKVEKDRADRSPLRFNIETKFPQDAQSKIPKTKVTEHVHALLSAIEKARVVERTTIQSFYLPALRTARQRNPRIETSALFAPTYFQGFVMTLGGGNEYRRKILQSTEEFGAGIVSPYFLYVTPEFVQKAHAENKKVVPWTVNEKKEMLRLIECGVDGIITDYPDRLRDLVEDLRKK